jgi:hypothetical protein
MRNRSGIFSVDRLMDFPGKRWRQTSGPHGTNKGKCLLSSGDLSEYQFSHARELPLLPSPYGWFRESSL